MFWFLLIALVVVVAAVALAVVGGGDGPGRTATGGLADALPDRTEAWLPPDRPLNRSDLEALRLPQAVRGYRMEEVDDVLDRLGAELAERDARIAELEASLAGTQAAALGGPGMFGEPGGGPGDRPGTAFGGESGAVPGEEPGGPGEPR
ncbi:DivIVA domain-containing protein [Streptomyces fenghuangensis]|uniref:DivIVA domain-containing protein n=1 Tax=Streptomyces chitinivorans TaxID=1257027 RepID=A0ABW7I072_9ACTN|nr:MULTISPECIES: DivIVA domain-containing protein [Streptomyces]MCG3042930.1 DivIVA domain-containing protein [Streptomyces sp. ICN903]MDH2412435.1 DivIVA domain-containing protein [Streptomyces chitinivorans]